MNDNNEFRKTANKVSIVSIIGNILLTLFKLFAGIVANSTAMISDAVHSASDVLGSLVVIIGVKLASEDPDEDHPYGHERLECVAAIVVSVLLFIIGLGIGKTAIETIGSGDYSSIKTPGVLALVAAGVSIIAKEAMYRYTMHYARKIDSAALVAEAWHHRSDALSSIGALIGIGAARMGYPVMDAVAGLVIFFFIIKAAIDIFKEAVDKMVDHSADDETELKLRERVSRNREVLGIDMLHTRVFGSRIYVDVEIEVDGSYTLAKAHEIAEEVHDDIEQNFPKVKHVMVHVNPKM